ncbi:mechanosensitive ion channel family protein [Marinirhabdus gelatinilytica]|uniref:Miniconductance mechanosensitive channel n=1 Tax=Marinirhabdus gelatinilytica TaxID=1703343 RepID=A0A370QA60_9FLAO|nr:mechanosensitive ion channel domain-containing protein [Marinirhabdus gelatinilytica]RDK85258.1 miniconductance mechanosensitive channel [Marinirhabdus gelatinilytica]
MNRETINTYACLLRNYLTDLGMGEYWAALLNVIANVIVVAVVATILDIVSRKIIVQLFKAFSDKTKTTFDDFLVKSNFPRFVAHFIPLGLVWYLLPSIFQDFEPVEQSVHTLALLYLVLLSILVFRSLLRTANNYLRYSKEKYSDKPLESYVQVLMIFAWSVGIFLLINILTDFSLKSLTTLGAFSAVLLLIFKDTILGFVASIQVSVNDIVRIGDWITFSKYGADGYVTEINLATVRVQNFDHTYTTIPTYSLIADSFQNWRGMQESTGRRIKRSIFIKQNSIKFLSAEELEQLKKIQLIAPYIEHRERDVTKYNKATEADKSLAINGRNQTNLGIFRKYADAFLHENPAINKEEFLMVRHLPPTNKGIPIEIFCYSYDKTWVNYEHIQADIFDHLIASVPYFGLELFESPSGKDLANISLNTRK